ncbi:MAG: GNAT family N-acetyltransferase [Pseudorhodoplanes sp.]
MNVAYQYPLPSTPSESTLLRHASRIARIDILSDVAAAEPAWRSLAAGDALATPYQRYEWIALWQKHVGRAEGIRPFIAVGYDAGNNPLFILPFGREKLGPFTVGRFFGGKHATLNTGIWRRDLAQTVTADEMKDILARISGHDVDLLMLFNQPETWRDLRNPLALLPHQPSSDQNSRLDLIKPGEETVKRQISATMRGRLRTKERKLAKLKGYRYRHVSAPDDVTRCLDAFFIQKAARLEAQGLDNVFARPGIEAFVRAACGNGLNAGEPVIELHALEADGELLALFAGTCDEYRFTSMFNSYTLGENARWSPGLILLIHLVKNCADRDIATFDVGPGNARYKTFFCKEHEKLFDSFLPLSARGHVLATALRQAYSAKRRIKNAPALWSAISGIRRAFGKSVDRNGAAHPEAD